MAMCASQMVRRPSQQEQGYAVQEAKKKKERKAKQMKAKAKQGLTNAYSTTTIVNVKAHYCSIVISYVQVEKKEPLQIPMTKVLGRPSKRRLLRLDDLGRRGCLEFSAKHSIPETAGDPESVVEVGKVVLKMILLERLVVGRKAVG